MAINFCKVFACAKKPLSQVAHDIQTFDDWRVRYREVEGTLVILQGHARERLDSVRAGNPDSVLSRICDLMKLDDVRREVYRSIAKWDGQKNAVVYYNDGKKASGVPKVATIVFDEQTRNGFVIERGRGYYLVKSLLDFGPGAWCGKDGVITVNYNTYACVVHEDNTVERLPTSNFPWAKMETESQFRRRLEKAKKYG